MEAGVRSKRPRAAAGEVGVRRSRLEGEAGCWEEAASVASPTREKRAAERRRRRH